MTIRKSIYAEPHKKDLKAVEAARTKAQKGDEPRFPWMIKGMEDGVCRILGGRRGLGDRKGF